MGFSWKIKRSKNHKPNSTELVIPHQFICPISLDLMKDPVTLSSGITYDRENIEAWLEEGKFNCPVTNIVLTSFDQIPNHSLRQMIQDWCVENRNHGIQRIPTPRVPVSPMQVSDLLSCIATSLQSLDGSACAELVQQINKWGSESERNKRCIRVNGASVVLATAFDAFARDSFEKNASLLEEILSALTWLFPLDMEAEKHLGSHDSLRCMVWLLKTAQLSTKQNTIIVLKELLSTNQNDVVEALANIEGVSELLFRLIEDPDSPTITKSSLMIIFYLTTSPISGVKIRSELISMGLVSLLLEVIIESERNISERALGVFDNLCDCEDGREEAYNNDLTWPVLVKKILRVSELATEYSVSTIWKLSNSKCERKHQEKALIEALQVGAFQKLVLLLQLGCGDDTKVKATELLKLMNPYRSGLECIESVDFKNLKRSF